MTWWLAGKQLDSSQEGITITAREDGVHCLDVSAVKANQAGELCCRAESAVGTAETKAQLAVRRKKAQQKPEFQTQLTAINLNEGDTLKAKLLISGGPAPKVKWYINDKIVVETEDVQMVAEDGIYTLSIRGVSKRGKQQSAAIIWRRL